MEWSEIGDMVASAAPAIGALLGGPAGAAIGGIVASILGTDDNPEAVAAALKKDPEALVKLREAQMQHAEQMRSLILQAETKRLAERTQQISEINQTMRAGLQSEHWFRAGWRPLLGYCMALIFVCITGAMIYAIVQDPSEIQSIMGTMAWLIGAMGGVLGVHIHKTGRAEETRITGQLPTTIAGALAAKRNPTK